MADIAKSALAPITQAKDRIGGQSFKKEGAYFENVSRELRSMKEPGSEHLPADSIFFLESIRKELFAERNQIAHELNEGDWIAWEGDAAGVLADGMRWRMNQQWNSTAMKANWEELCRFARTQKMERQNRSRGKRGRGGMKRHK